MTKQEIFEHISGCLLKQNAKSREEGCCRYRGDNNMKCAIGFLIPDSLYTEELEGYTVNNTKFIEVLEDTGIDFDENISMLNDLQATHDWVDVVNWREKLISIAIEYQLDYSFLN